MLPEEFLIQLVPEYFLPTIHLIFSSSSTISREYLYSHCEFHEDRSDNSVLSFEIFLDTLDALFN